MMKPKIIAGYDASVTEACERVLVTLLRGLGPWKGSVFLVGGLAPRYLVSARPPEVPHHAGTSDVDIVVDMSMLTDMEAYATLEENLLSMNFARLVNAKGQEVNWRWQTVVDGMTIVLEFLAYSPKLGASRVIELPTDSKVTAINIPHASLVFDFHKSIEITADLLSGRGRATQTVRYADIVSFTCLKAFAFEHRNEPKDAHDLVYCLEYLDGGLDAARAAFRAALEGEHADVIRAAIVSLTLRFCDKNPDESYLREGPVAVARFEDNDIDIDSDDELRNRRLLRQRRAADLMAEFLMPLQPCA